MLAWWRRHQCGRFLASSWSVTSTAALPTANKCRIEIQVSCWAGDARRVPAMQFKLYVRVSNEHGLFSGRFGRWLAGGAGGKTVTFSGQQAGLIK